MVDLRGAGHTVVAALEEVGGQDRVADQEEVVLALPKIKGR